MMRTVMTMRAPLLAALALVTAAPSTGAQSLPPLDEYHVRVFDVTDGLLVGDVRGLAQTADGYLYVASARGLSRFDGHEFRHLPLAGFRSSFLAGLHADPQGRLWVRSTAGDAAVLANGRLRLLPDGVGPAGEVGGVRAARAEARPVADDVARLAGHDRLLERLLERLPDSLAGLRIVRDAPARDAPARDGVRWLAVRFPGDARDHLARVRDDGLDVIPLRDRLDFTQISELLVDHEESLWVGTDRGLLQLSPRKVLAITRRHGLAESFTVPVLQTRDGAVWVGSWGGGLHRFADGRLADHVTTAGGLPSDRVRALHEAADGTLWVGTDGGVAAIRERRVVLSRPMRSQARSFAESADGTLWVGTVAGLLRWTGRDFVEHRPDVLRDRHVWALHVARDGALWVGGERGLFRLAGGDVTAFGEADGLRSTFVVSIHEEGDGTLWFGTYEHGLHRYRGGRFVAVTTREGLHHDGVWRMLEDGHGGVWMSSDQGVFRVAHARLHATADALERGERPPAPLVPVVFTEAEGMPSRECNRASPGGWRLSDGRLVFNNLAGVVVVDPLRALAPPPPPRTLLQGVVADGHPVAMHGAAPARLPPGTRQLAFDFAALSFAAPDQHRYRYRLDGYDDGWLSGGTQRRATYTNLPPGRYAFRVQGASGSSGWGEPGAAYAFVVQPFVWQAWWFQLLALTAALAALAAAYRYRVARLLELERLRLRIASDLHDDIGSTLSSIALMSEMLGAGARFDAAERHQLRRIRAAAEESIGALRDIIWLVDPKHDDLADLLRRMRVVAGDLLNGAEWRFEARVSSSARRLDMAFMRNVLLLYKEALHNVARHARARHVHVEVGDARGTLVLRVSDDGVGFVACDAGRGRGLASMRRRARQSGGRLEVASAPGEGTRVTFSAPMA